MTREDVVSALVVTLPWLAPGDVVYVDRRGDGYGWRAVEGTELAPTTADLPDAWLFHSGPWPSTDAVDAFAEDLVAELDAMTGGDRCRWPLDEPWPHQH